MVTVKRLCDYLEMEFRFRMIVHNTINNVAYAMYVQNDNDEKFKKLLQKNSESDKLYILRQCMTLIALTMIEMGEY